MLGVGGEGILLVVAGGGEKRGDAGYVVEVDEVGDGGPGVQIRGRAGDIF